MASQPSRLPMGSSASPPRPALSLRMGAFSAPGASHLAEQLDPGLRSTPQPSAASPLICIGTEVPGTEKTPLAEG